MKRIAVASLAVLGLVSPANAGVEIGGVAGAHIFAGDNALGTKDNDPLKHANSALFALRLGVGIGRMFAVELEGGLIPTESDGTNTQFDIFDAVLRANVLAQFRTANPDNKVIPFVLLGGGAMRIVDVSTSDESLIKKETDGEIHLGVGAKYLAGNGWGVRLDVRAIGVPSDEDKAVTFDFEVLLGLYRDFGYVKKAKKEAPKVDPDPDQDGITGDTDKCPDDPEDKDSFEDEDGCPDPDNDADGIPDETDKCPTEAEDKDNFQDDDGCPDPDNDADGVPDAADKCVDQPETRNGFEDEDGCPDEVPEKLAKFTGTIQGINFKTASADLLPASKKVLDKAVAVLAEFKDVKLEIAGHTDDVQIKNSKKFADNDALSQARADTVKAYFVSKGIAEDRVVAKGYGATKPITEPSDLKGGKLAKARAQNRRVEFTLIPSEGRAAPAPAETGTETGTEGGASAPAGDAPAGDAPPADAPKSE